MIGRLVQRAVVALRGDRHNEADEADDESVFAGSILDWSVNYGGPDIGGEEAAREMAQIQEKAKMLDEKDHHRR